MRRMLLGMTVIGLALGGGSTRVSTQTQPLGFFITSVGKGDGANLGGLAGADAHCQALAKAAGAGNRTWRAYLSATAAGGQAAVNAKDRIGAGPWYNAKGVMVAAERRRSPQRGDDEGGQGELADREGHGEQRPRRHAEPARHPHRVEHGRHGWQPAPATRRAATGRATRATAAHWSVTTTGRAAAPTPTRGTRPIRRRAAARRT